VQEMLGRGKELWVVTPVGIQRLWTDANQIANQSLSLANNQLTTIRRAGDGRVYAGAGGKAAWRFDERSGWQNVSGDLQASDFGPPLQGPVSNLVRWERGFAQGQEVFKLIAAGNPLGLVQGKLAPDYVNSVAGLGELRWQATPAGIVESRVTTGDI